MSLLLMLARAVFRTPSRSIAFGRRPLPISRPLLRTKMEIHHPVSQDLPPDAIVENVELSFVEEPLGLRADQGYGYLQVDFGQRIGPSNQYEILRKLGWGMNASVWLARDHESNRYVAIKALKGLTTDFHHQGYVQELHVMQRLTRIVELFNQPSYCTTLLAHFIHPGKPGDGEHLCLVMKLFAGDIESFQKELKALPIAFAKLVLRDTLRGLSQLHAAGCVHTDLKAANIMCDLPESTSESNVRALLETSPSRRHPPEQSWDYKVEAALSQPLSMPSIQQALSALYCIGDFGSAQLVDQQVTPIITPETLRAPETIMRGPWDSKVDIWTFGCLVFEFICGRPLFSRRHDSMAPDNYHLVQMIKFTGEEFPPDLIKTYKYADQFLDMETGYLAAIQKPVATLHFSRIFKHNGEQLALSAHDINGAVNLMSRCLRVDPANRPSAIQLLRESTWLLELGDDFGHVDDMVRNCNRPSPRAK